jgi:hypothetical protein
MSEPQLVDQLRAEIRYLRALFFEHVGTDPENVQTFEGWTEEQAEEDDFSRRVEERRCRMYGERGRAG